MTAALPPPQPPPAKTAAKTPPPKKSLWKRCEMVIYLGLYFLFLFLGGLFINLIEGENDKQVKNTKRKELLAVLDKYDILPNNTMILDIMRATSNLLSVKGLNLKDLTAEVDTIWGYSGGLFYCATLITTIGYGDRFPITTGGRCFTIFYALIGIPLTGFVLVKIGIILTNLIKKLDSTLSRQVKRILGKVAVDSAKLKFYVRIVQLIVVFSIFILTFWILPAIIMVEIEDDWSYMTAIYFCFITITTVGLGDITPGTASDNAQNFDEFDWKDAALQLSTLFYFILGLSALSIILTLIKSLLNSIGEIAMTTAGDFSNKSMKLMGNMASTVKNKGRKVSSITDVDNPTSKNLSDIPEEYMTPTKEKNKFSIDNFLEEEEETDEDFFNMAYEGDDVDNNEPATMAEAPNDAESSSVNEQNTERSSSTTLLMPDQDPPNQMPSVV